MGSDRTEITATWQGEMAFIGENEAGGKTQMGLLNGQPGIQPMALVLVALAGCTGVDVVSILKKKRVNFSDIKVEVSAARADTHPKVYTDIQMTYLIWGEGIKAKDVEQAIELSEGKYCSVSAMLKATAEIHTDYRILASGEPVD